MLKLCRAGKYFPLRIADLDATSGPRIGGSPPKGVMPPVIIPHTRYFATLPLDHDAKIEVSVFTSISENLEDDLFITRQICKMHIEGFPLVQFVVHPCSSRSQERLLESEYSSQSLLVGEELADIPDDLYVGNKIGGTPFFHRARPEVLEATSVLLAEGYVLFVQFGGTMPGDGGEGAWQLNNFVLSVFAKAVDHNFRFRYVFT